MEQWNPPPTTSTSLNMKDYCALPRPGEFLVLLQGWSTGYRRSVFL